MKNFDFIIQRTWLVICSALLTFGLFSEEVLGIVALMLFFLGVYHMLHYILNTLNILINERKINVYIYAYPLFVTTFFLFWTSYFHLMDETLAWHLFMAHAISIGGYYCYSVHGKL